MAVAMLLLATALAGQQPETQPEQQDSDTTVREAIAVVEASVIAAFPRLSAKRAGELEPDDLVAIESDKRRAVTRIARIDPKGGAPWTVLAYFDLTLSDPETPQVAAFTLGELSQRLADLGAVQTLIARDGMVERLPVARDVGQVERIMARLTHERGTDRFDRQRLSARPRDVHEGRALLEESRLLRQRADLLISEAAATCIAPPCLLLLVSDGFDLRTDLFHSLDGEAPPGIEDPSAIAEEVGRVLAGLGYVVIALPLRSSEVLVAEERARLREQQRGAGTDFDDWRDHVAGAREGGTNPSNLPEPDPKSRDQAADSSDTWVLPKLEPLRQWAVASSGQVLREPEHVDPALAELGEFWTVYFRTERSPDGELRPFELRFSESGDFQQDRRLRERLGLVPDEEPVRYPRWVRSSAPPELSAARLRRVADDDAPLGAIATREKQGGASRVVVSAGEGKTRVRVSRLDAAGAVQHRIVEVEGDGRRAAVPLEADESTGALVVQNLESGAWMYVDAK